MDKTWRSLIFLGDDDNGRHHHFAAESESLRLTGKGGLGHLVTVDEHYLWSCNCLSYTKDGTCWHVVEAPIALRYWQARLKLGDMQHQPFDELFGTWWPRREAIMARCAQEGAYKKKSGEEWELWYASLLDERDARAVAVRNLEQTWGLGAAEAMGVK